MGDEVGSIFSVGWSSFFCFFAGGSSGVLLVLLLLLPIEFWSWLSLSFCFCCSVGSFMVKRMVVVFETVGFVVVFAVCGQRRCVCCFSGTVVLVGFACS